MKRMGVCYDVGRVMWGQNWRPELSPAEVLRELEIIKDDLHCNAVRICGQDIDRLANAGEQAMDRGLEVWLSPELWDRSPEETLDYIAAAAERAEELRRRRPGQLVLSVGSELTLFMNGIVEGGSVFERLEHPLFWDYVRSGAHNATLNAFLAKANDRVRRAFRGRVTYASVPFESVDWSLFDFASVDLYRGTQLSPDQFTDILRRFFAPGLPVAITEFGCCTYRGAAAAGGRGFAIIDHHKQPPQLNGEYLRAESEQARELREMLGIFEDAGVDAAFVMTFVDPLHPYSEDPKFDLDMASYSLVRSYGSRLGALGSEYPRAPWDRTRLGTTYPDLPWDPKESFKAVADFYGAMARS
ncbi:MAG TPA: abortive infection protein [Candidatus Dormibacteraeota bacterium]|nr:abortive infection protein [Candidatus Dormibacteraeota bacterium]